MAFYVLLVKQFEDETVAEYSFGKGEEATERLRIVKETGDVEGVDGAEVRSAEDFVRAAMKLRQHWREGSFPARTSWAS